MLLLMFVACLNACYADLWSLSPADFQQAGDIKISSIVHNTPSAVSHMNFTRVHNHQPAYHSPQTQAAAMHQAPTVAVQPVYTTSIQQLHVIPAPQIIKPQQVAAVKREPTMSDSLRHTPAHLTFAARPVVYQMLPEIKPVRQISFDELVPSPRKVEYMQGDGK